MSSNKSTGRREAAREAAKKAREAELRKQRTTKIVLISVVTVLALIVAGLIGLGIHRSNQGGDSSGDVVAPQGLPEGAAYLPLGSDADDAVVVDVYSDYQCPYCQQFEEINGAALQQLADDGTIQVRLHPRRLLDQVTTSGDFSSRSAAAVAAVWEDNPENVWAFEKLMFDNQPSEQSREGMTTDQIVDYAAQAGASDTAQKAIEDETYVPWVQDVVEPDAADNTDGTPAIKVAGKDFTEDWTDPDALPKAIQAAAGSTASDGSGSSDASGSDGSNG